MVYGYDAQSRNDDRLVKVSRELVQFGTRIILPGALLVNNIPFREHSALYDCIRYIWLRSIHLVRYIPGWLSWFSYKPLARYGYKLGQEVMHQPMSFAKESMVRRYSAIGVRLEAHSSLGQWHCSTVTCSGESTRDGGTAWSRARKGRKSCY
jgi:hypothetical protein